MGTSKSSAKTSTTTIPATTESSNPGELQGRPTGLNLCVLTGEIVTEPESRILPSGSIALSFSVTVRAEGQKTTSVPVVWYDPPKSATGWSGGDQVVVQGSVVRRFFRGGGGLGSSTEVVAKHAALIRQRAKAQAVLHRVEREFNTLVGPE